MSGPAYEAPFRAGGAFEIDQAIASRLLTEALSRGGDYADLYYEFRANAGYGFEEGILRSAGKATAVGLGIRVMQGDATGYAYVEELTMDSMLKAASTAAQIAAGGKTHTAAAMHARQLPSRYPVSLLSLEVGGEMKRQLLQRADAAARAEDSRIQRVECSFNEEIREILVATSDGHFLFDRQPLLRFGVRVIAQEGDQRQAGSSGGGGRVGLEYFNEKSPEWHAKQAVQHALTMLEAVDAPAGELPVVLAPGDSGVLLHEAVGHGLEADFNRKKTSNYTDCIGQSVASELCTVVDDASLDHSRGSINIDDEGNLPTSVTLIEKGILRGYMHDRHSAEFFHTQASGNGRRESFKCPPMPRMTNTMLLNGPHAAEEIISSVQRGIYAKKFGGGQVDISNGDFVFNLTEAYLIENGKLGAPVKGVNLIGNGPEIMRRVTMLGNDMQVSDGIWTCGKDGQSVPVGVGCPTTKISSITVGGTKLG